MAVDPLNAPPVDPAEPQIPERKRGVTCEACECVLFADGSVKTTSARWKKLRESDETITRLEKDNKELQGKLETAQQTAEDLQVKLDGKHVPPENAHPPNGGEQKKKSGWAF
jgi:hypothetical protein